MSGAIKREEGESFVSFTARQRAAQAAEKATAACTQKHARWARRARRESARTFAWYDGIDHDHSMDN